MAIMHRRGINFRDEYRNIVGVETKEGESFDDYFIRCRQFFDTEEKARMEFFSKRNLTDLENK